LERHTRIKAKLYGFAVVPTVTEIGHEFSYLHPLSGGYLQPEPASQLPTISVSAPVVLQFGMVNAKCVAHGTRVIFDPQSPLSPAHFAELGSSAEHLAIVLNRQEATRLSGKIDIGEAAKTIQASETAEVVVVKDGPRGALLLYDGTEHYIPVFDAKETYLVGSGDVFSAIFALEWGVKKTDPVTAANAASLSTALWCATRDFPLPKDPSEVEAKAQRLDSATGIPTIYLASPFFSVAQLWLLNDVRHILQDMGVKVFSPYHDVGLARDPLHNVAQDDLKGMLGCQAVLALLDGSDPGTIFELGYARNHGIPVIGFRSEPATENADTMLVGTGCLITGDLGNAVYKAIWAATAPKC
jgi:hypothetical protein